jgi:hypothetical protein
VQYLKEVLQAIAAYTDLLITHHSLIAVPGAILGAAQVCQIGAYSNRHAKSQAKSGSDLIT